MGVLTSLAMAAGSLYMQKKQADKEQDLTKKQLREQENLKTEEKKRANKEAELLAAKARKKTTGGYKSTMGGSTTSFGGY